MTSNIINALTRVSLMSWLDRQRGTPKEAEKIPKLAALLGMGYLCAAYTRQCFNLNAPLSGNNGYAYSIGLTDNRNTKPAAGGFFITTTEGKL